MKQLFKMLTALTLSFMLVFTSLAAPAVADTVQSTNEEAVTIDSVDVAANESEADLAADVVVITGTEETLIKEYSFDTDAEGWKFISETWTYDGGTAGGQSFEGGLDGDGAYYIESVIEKKTDTVGGKTKNYGIDLRVENKNLNFETDAITKIEVRVKNTTGKSQSLKMFWITENYPIDEARTMSQSYDGSDWTVITYDMTGLTADNGWVNTLTGIRFKLGTEAMNSYSIDYIKFYGYETEVHEWLPGYNILTGTEKPLTFDDGTYSVSGLKVLDEAKNTVMTAKDVASISVVPSPVSAQDGYVVKYDITDLPKGTSKYPKVYFDHKDSSGKYVNKMPPDGRPIYVGYNVLVHNADNLSKEATRYNWIMSTGSVHTGHKYDIPKWYLSTETPVWYETKGVNIPIVGGAIPFLQMSYVSGANFTDEMVKPIFYFDNFMYVPYYKVTYKDGDTELGNAYVLDDGAGNLLTSFDPNDYDNELTLPETINAWSLTDGGEATHNITLNNEDIVVYAVHERNFTPGYNILTGTADPLTFDNLANGTHTGGQLVDAEGNVVLSYDNDKTQTQNINVIDTPVAGETGKALEFSGYGYNTSNTCYPKLKFYNYEAPNDGRPVLIKLDAFSKKLYDESTTKLTSNATAIYPLYNGGGNGAVSIKLYDYNAAPAWVHGFHKDEKSGANGLATIQFSTSVTADGLAKATEEGVDIVHNFVDNVGYYPYYKVTYMNGATEIDSVYVLDDGKGNFLSQIDPNAYGVEIPEGKFSWSLTDNGQAVNVVALENEDIVLYATDDFIIPNNTILSFEFNDEKSLNDWTFARIKDGKAAIKDGKLVFTAVNDGSWDTVMNNDKIRFKVDDVKTVEMRVKIVDETGETPTAVDMSTTTYPCDFHYRLDATSGWTNNYTANKYSYYTPDEEGYYTLTWTAEELAVKGWSGEMNYLRFDPHAALPLEATAYVDYIRFYGDPTDDFKPAAYAPEKREGVSLKVADEETTGVRFKAAMSNTARADSKLTEYGWIVALAPTLSGAELTHGFESSNGKQAYVEGIAYDTAKNIDRIFDNSSEPDYTIFTAVVVGIPSDKADIELVIRPFSRASGGAYLYGECRVISPRAVGQKIYDDYVAKGCPEGHDYVTYQAFIDSLGITK